MNSELSAASSTTGLSTPPSISSTVANPSGVGAGVELAAPGSGVDSAWDTSSRSNRSSIAGRSETIGADTWRAP